MKSIKFLYIFAALIIFPGAFYSQTVKITPIQPAGNESVKLPELRAELLERMKRDQASRAEISAKHKDSPALIEEMRKIDQENTSWIRKQMNQHGWLGTSKVGFDGAQAAFLLVQHAVHEQEFQKQALEFLEKAVKVGEALPVHLAYLTDRVRLVQGKPQVYGTQTRVTKEGKFEVPPIEDEANVDKRRAEVGLEPLADYIQKMRKRYDKSPN